MDSASSAISNLISSIPSAGTRTEENTTSAAPTTTSKETTSTGTTSTGSTSSSTTAPSQAEPSSTTYVEKDTTVTEDVAPAVEHEHITKQHETREQEVIEKEKHQDHYHTTIQPLKDSEVLDTKHDEETAKSEFRSFNHDDQAAKEAAEADRSGFESTTESKTLESTTREAPAQSSEHVHHHLHETIQPVIEKEVIAPSVTHKTIPVTERHQEASVNHGVTTNEAISVDDFKNKLDGDRNPQQVVEGDVISE